MAEKLVYVKPNEIKESIMKLGWLQEFGSYNRIPLPFEKLSETKLSEIAKRGTPEYMEYRMLAVIEGESDKYIPAQIYWYNDTGMMVVFDDNNLMEFYQLGCNHDYESKYENGRTDMTCKLCGYKDVVYDDVPIEEVKQE